MSGAIVPSSAAEADTYYIDVLIQEQADASTATTAADCQNLADVIHVAQNLVAAMEAQLENT